MNRPSTSEWILRLGVFGTFLGHGCYALMHKPAWLHFITYWGIPTSTAWMLMSVIGLIDLVIAITTLLRPIKPILLYAFFWAFVTALMRPIAGGHILDFVERSSNWAAPLALYWFLYLRSSRSQGDKPTD